MRASTISTSVLIFALPFFAAALLRGQEGKVGRGQDKNEQSNVTPSGSWSGVIINGNCTPDEAFAEAAKCTEKTAPGAKLALYDDTRRLVLILDPQTPAEGHLGDSVVVEGTLEGSAIHVTSFKMLTGIGLAVGHKAPAFSAQDQFGAHQTLETLRGPKGTVLLFFRSADW